MADHEIMLHGAVALHGSDDHPHAARRLREHFGGLRWTDGGADASIELRQDPDLPEGAFRIDAAPGRVTVRGGPFSGVIYGVEELIDRGAPDALRAPAGVTADDSCHNWFNTAVFPGQPSIAW